METFTALLVLCAGNSPVTGEFPHKGQWRGALVFSLIFAWTNVLVNSRDAGDLRCNRAHYDVTIMRYDDLATTNVTLTIAHLEMEHLYGISTGAPFPNMDSL